MKNQTINFDIYVEKLFEVMANKEDKIIPNLSYILKECKDTNSKPYRDAINILLKQRIWVKVKNGWTVSSIGKNFDIIAKECYSNLDKNDVIDSAKNQDYMTPLNKIVSEYTLDKNDKTKYDFSKLNNVISGDVGLLIMNNLIKTRAITIGISEVENELKDIINQLKKEKGIVSKTQKPINDL